MTNIWFTADTHFGHRSAITHNDRPWVDAEAMDEGLIQNWNSLIGPKDLVWFLGDFNWRGDPGVYWKRLNGNISICWGNHDERSKSQLKKLANWCGDVKYLRAQNERFFLSHYAHRTWRNSHHGSYHLYGHSHGALPGYGKSMDVGVDANNYYPVHIDQVLFYLKDQALVDHHVAD